MINKDNARITITLSKKVNEKLIELAKKDNRSISNYLSVLIDKEEE